MRELSLFTGIGGGLIASKLLGWKTVCAVEINEYCRKILMARQEDGLLDQFPIWKDVKAFNLDRFTKGGREPVQIDVISGGFP